MVDPREVEPLVARPPHFVDAALDRGEHPQPEQVDLEEAGVGAGVLVPLDDLAPLHRRRDDRADVDQRPGRDHHPARVLGGVAGQAHRLAAELEQRPPAGEAARRGPIAATTSRSISTVALVEADHLRHPLDLARRQRQRLAEVAHRRRAGGRWGRRRPGPSGRRRRRSCTRGIRTSRMSRGKSRSMSGHRGRLRR